MEVFQSEWQIVLLLYYIFNIKILHVFLRGITMVSLKTALLISKQRRHISLHLQSSGASQWQEVGVAVSLSNQRRHLSSCCLPLALILPHFPPINIMGDHCSVTREGQAGLQMKVEKNGGQGRGEERPDKCNRSSKGFEKRSCI